MMKLGIDTLSWHMRLESGHVTLDDVLDQSAQLGAEFVQVELHHLRNAPLGQVNAIAAHARDLGLGLTATGGPLGQSYFGGSKQLALEATDEWLARAVTLGSQFLIVYPGAPRPSTAGDPAIAGDRSRMGAELDYFIDVLREGAPRAEAAGVTLLVENASNPREEFQVILEEVAHPAVRVFLDLVNPILTFEEPLPVIRQLAPDALAGHIKDYVLENTWTDDEYHRYGYSTWFKYPGEGVADLRAATHELLDVLAGREFLLSIEGLDSRADRDDQIPRLEKSMRYVRALLDSNGSPGKKSHMGIAHRSTQAP